VKNTVKNTMKNMMRFTLPLTVRQRIGVYVVLAALSGLACGGVDFKINANSMDAVVPAATELDCAVQQSEHRCSKSVWSGGTCQLTACTRPPDNPSKPVTNCPFGRTNQGRAWTATECRDRALHSGCTEGTLFSFGCNGYVCSDTRCAQ
jgi:hypothetical protein